MFATAVGQAIVLTKGPLDLLRGGGSGEEKLLKNARDEVASEALEIAIYDAVEALATALGDEPTAKLAARHRGQEERMLAELRAHIPHLAHALVQARAGGRPSFTGRPRARPRPSARPAARPGAAKPAEPPTAGYESLTASEVVSKLAGFTQEQLRP